MLQSRNLLGVLSQVIQSEKISDSEPRSSIVSSILITVSGLPIASYHANRTPSPPRTSRFSTLAHDESTAEAVLGRGHYEHPTLASASSSNSAGSSSGTQPYEVSRSMKTKVYALFASSAWQEYQRAGMGHVTAASDAKRDGGEVEDFQVNQESEPSYSNQHDWICFKTEDATQILITPVNLQSTSSQLLLILVADEGCPLGMILKKSQETVKVLEEGLDKYRVYE